MDLNRRELLAAAGKFIILSGAALEAFESASGAVAADSKYKMADHWWAMTIDIQKCIGCGNCVRACASENDVPEGFVRTWIERYEVSGDDREHPHVESPAGGIHGFSFRNSAITAPIPPAFRPAR
jgi:tetrathionate reductase subunit B